MVAENWKRRGKNQVAVESKVVGEIVVQHMSGDVSGKEQKYSRIGAQEYVPFEQNQLPIHNIKEACQKYFWPQIEKDLVCDVLAGEHGSSHNKVAQNSKQKSVWSLVSTCIITFNILLTTTFVSKGPIWGTFNTVVKGCPS